MTTMPKLTTKRRINLRSLFPISTTSPHCKFAKGLWANRLLCNSAFLASPSGLACPSYRKRLVLSIFAVQSGRLFYTIIRRPSRSRAMRLFLSTSCPAGTFLGCA